MKWRSPFAVLVLVAMMPVAMLMATPRVILHKPPPGRYGIEDLWKATVTADTICDAWFEGFVFEETQGQVFHATTKPFRLTLGSRVYGYRNVTIDKTEAATGYEVFVTRSGTLSYGRYRFKLILKPFDVGDSNEFEVKPTGPPRLISPREGAALPGGQKNPVFSWTRPAPTPPGQVTYELKLFEVLPGQTPEEAMKSNPPWFERKSLRATSLTYPTSARKLEAGKNFAWEVTAIPGGASDVWSFAVVPPGRVLTRPEAIRMVMDGLVLPETSETAVTAFLTLAPLKDGDVVRPKFQEDKSRRIRGPTWFAWIDDCPLALFAHETRYVYINAYTGQLEVETQEFWPLINQGPVFALRGEECLIFTHPALLELEQGGR